MASKTPSKKAKVSAHKNGAGAVTLTVELWDIGRPIPYARNARKIPQSAVDKVAASIKHFGWRQPLVVDADGVIIAGHTRLLAAQKLGMKEVPVHVAHDMSPSDVRAYRLADNRIAQESSFDDELVRLEITDLKLEDLDLSLTGFDPKELDKLLGEASDSNDDGADEPNYNPKWLVLVECRDESQQVELLERFTEEGLVCKAMNG